MHAFGRVTYLAKIFCPILVAACLQARAGVLVFPPPDGATRCQTTVVGNTCGTAVEFVEGSFMAGSSGTEYRGGQDFPYCVSPYISFTFDYAGATNTSITIRNDAFVSGESLSTTVQDVNPDGSITSTTSQVPFPAGQTVTVTPTGRSILQLNLVVLDSSGNADWNSAAWAVTSMSATQPINPVVNLAIARNGDGTYTAVVTYSFPSNSVSSDRTLTLSLLPTGQNDGVTYFTRSGLDVSGSITQALGTLDTDRMLRAVATACDGMAEQVASTADCGTCGGQPQTSVGGPVRLFDGVMTYSETDPLPVTIGSEFRRAYSSGVAAIGKFGQGWSSIFDASSTLVDPVAGIAVVITEDRTKFVFRQSGSGPWVQTWPAGSAAATLTGSDVTGFVFRDASGSIIRTFDTNHHLIRVQDVRRVRAVSISYDQTGNPTRIFDEAGNWSCTVTTANGLVTGISVDGRPDLAWTYTYAGSLLTSVSVAGAPSAWRTYQYTNNLLSGIVDATGTVIERHDYDGVGRATSSYATSSGDITAIAYAATDTNAVSTTSVTRPDTTQATYQQGFAGGRVATQHVDSGCGSCGLNDATAAYDANGNVFRLQNGRGYVTESTYDATGRHLTQTVTAEVPSGCDPTTDPNHCRLTSAALATNSLATTAASQTTTYTYGDSNWPNQPTRIGRDSVRGGTNTETFTLDATSGEPLIHTLTGAIAYSTEESHTTTTTLYATGEAAAFAPGGAFQTAWQSLPQPPGLKKSVDGPRTDVADITTFVYYPFDASVPGSWRGLLAAVRNPMGHITRYEDYDVFGHAATMTDPNGIVTRMTFDALGRVLTSTVAGIPGCNTSVDPLCATDLTTTRAYINTTGPLASEQRPAGNTTSYTYDARGRLLTVTRGNGSTGLEQTTYAYDPSTGKKSSETLSAFESNAWVTKKTETYTYTSDGNLSSVVHGDNTAVHYAYLPDGTLASVQDENHTTPNTTYAYDPANRVSSVTQTLSTAYNGQIVTNYGYDVLGNLTSVADPNGNQTTYVFDDFGRMQQQYSPVSGTTAYTYDPAGNVLTTTDANGAVTTRTYDAINRVTSSASTRNGNTETITWTYDDTLAGNYGIGHPTTMTDPTGSTAYTYERRGLLQSEVKTINANGYTTAYTYDANGNRNKITYPSGLVAQYTFDFADRAYSLNAGGTNVVAAATYLPSGPITGLTFGNGVTRSVQYDNRYRPLENKITGPTGTLADYTYAADNVGNITQIHDATNPAYNRDFSYDDINRLTTANSGSSLWGSGNYSYDRMGNLSSSTLGTWKSTTATLVGTTPKLSSMLDGGISRPVTYDSAGNETAVGASTFTYSPRNELVAADTATYAYDGRGLLTLSTEPPTTLSIPASLKGGSAGTGTVTLGVAAGADTAVSLTSNNAAAVVPPSVTIPAGGTSATFTVATTGVAADTPVLITATINGTSLSATLVVLAPQLSAFTVNPTTVRGGDQITATLTLDSPAVVPTTVSIGGNLVNMPVSGSIAVGAMSTNITAIVNRLGYTQQQLVAFIGSTYNGQPELTTWITELPPAISSFSMTPSTVVGGDLATAQATVTGSAAFLPYNGMNVPVTSTNPSLAGAPAAIYLSTDTSGSTTVLTAPVTSSSSVVLTGTSGGVSLSGSLTLQPAPVTISSLSVSPTSLTGSASATGTITLTAAAPTGGLDIEVSTNSTSAVPAPTFVHINAGSSSATFAINTTSVATSTAVTISATHSATTKTTSLTVSAASGNYVYSLVAGNGTPVANGVAVQGGTSLSATVNLGAAATSNAKVNLSSSNSAVASVPSSVTVSKGAWSAGFTITTSSVTSPATATVTATYGGVSQKLNVTVLPANAVTVVGITGIRSPLQGGVGAYGTVTLTGPAPAGGAVIALGGTRTNIFTLPASMTIAAGATSGYFSYTASEFLANAHTTDVTATYGGITQAFRVTISPVTLTQSLPGLEPQSTTQSPDENHDSHPPLRAVATAAGDPSRYYLYTPELQVMAETEQSTSDPKSVAYSYLWFGGQPVAQIDGGGNVRTYATDHLGTPFLMTDATGAVVWRAEYSPYGDVFSYPAGASMHQPLRFPGQVKIDTGELAYNIFRWYRSPWARYTQTDPLGVTLVDLTPGARGISHQPYTYASGDPVVRIDRRGLYDCYYSIAAHTMTCSPSEDEANPEFHSSAFVSGNNYDPRCRDCRDNPNRMDVSDHGPIPAGDYVIGPPNAPGSHVRALTPDPTFIGPRIGGYRTGLELHGCRYPSSCSRGCIGATLNAVRDELTRDLSLEEGYNTLHVFP